MPGKNNTPVGSIHINRAIFAERMENMRYRLKATKTKLYKLLSDTIGNLPKMKDTEFKSYRRTYWLRYRETRFDNLMRICFDCATGSAHLIVKNLSDGSDYVVHLDWDDLKERGMVEAITN